MNPLRWFYGGQQSTFRTKCFNINESRLAGSNFSEFYWVFFGVFIYHHPYDRGEGFQSHIFIQHSIIRYSGSANLQSGSVLLTELLRLGIHILCRGGDRFSELEGPKFFLLFLPPLRPYPAEVPGFTRISWVVLVEVGGPDPWTPWPAPPLILWLMS
jgi:hypothetical protein